MVTVEVLAALDGLLWLRTGDRAAALLECTQSTVSRNSRRCLDVFRLAMHKRDGEWILQGDQTLLDLERQVHQLLRWQEGRGLRLEAQHWCAHLLVPDAPPPWFAGNANYFEYARPLQLLQQGVIDDWICSAPDLPQHPQLLALPLTAMPLQLVVKPGHPLLARGAALDFAELADYPVLPLPEGAFPIAQRELADRGLWCCPERDARLRQAPWFGRVPLEDLMIGLETPLRRAAGLAGAVVPLPLTLPIQVGEALLVKRDYASHPRLLALAMALLQRADRWARDLPEVTLLDPWAGLEAQSGLKRSATPLLQ